MGLLPEGPIDTVGYLDTILTLPARIEAALEVDPIQGLPAVTEVDHVTLLCAGQLTTGAELAAALAAPVSSIPVVARGPGPVPAAVGARSLVVAVGGDDPGLARTCRVASERGATVVDVAVPGGPPAVTRLAASAVAVRLLAVLEQLGQFAEVAESAAAAVTQLERRRRALTNGDDPARTLARRVGRTLPVVYGTDVLGGVAADRWKRQVNATAKAAAFANHLPALTEDEIAGWGQHGDMTRQVFSLLVLRHDHEPDGTADQVARVEELVDEVVSDRHVVTAEGDGSMAQVLDLVFVGDLFAYHLAQELEIDPGPVAAIDRVRGDDLG